MEVRQGRVRDNTAHTDERVRFTSSMVPACLRRTAAIEELLPRWYLQGVSSGGFQEALQALVGEKAKGVSPYAIVRRLDPSAVHEPPLVLRLRLLPP